MKVLYFFLGLGTLILSACGGEPFGPELLIGSSPTAGEAGQAVAMGAAGTPDAIGAAGAGGDALSAAGAHAASGGVTSAAGASSGGASAGSGGAAAVPPPPDPPCSPATNVSSKVKMDLGTIAWCLKTTDDLNHIACTNWDTREIRVNDRVVRCGMKFTAGPRASDGYNYIQIAPGSSDMASIDWSLI
jgi:hypothetical protein